MPISLTSGLGASLFPAQAASLQAQSLATAAQEQSLMATLSRGNILYDIQDRPEAKMPRLVTLWTVPVPLERAADAMRDVDRWAEWMPRFTTSQKHPSGRPDSYLQEARMKAAGMTIHYQILVHERRLDQGLQIYWGLEETGFRKDRLAMGLKINNGSCAFHPLNENETFVAYMIHTQVTPLVFGTAGKITSTTIEELPKFPASLASRSVNPQWTSQSSPLFSPMKMLRAP
jgi:hypothetical protein